MKQAIIEAYTTEANGNPAGGTTKGVGIDIEWQDGPVAPGGVPNGAFVEGVLQAAIGRLQFYQTANGGKLACRENAIALTHLETALLWLEKRTADREARKVEGTYKP